MTPWLMQRVRELAVKLAALAGIEARVVALEKDREFNDGVVEQHANAIDHRSREIGALEKRVKALEDPYRNQRLVEAAKLASGIMKPATDEAEIRRIMKPDLDAIVRDVNTANARASVDLSGRLNGAQDTLNTIKRSLTEVEDRQIDQGKRICDLEERGQAKPKKKAARMKMLPEPKTKGS